MAAETLDEEGTVDEKGMYIKSAVDSILLDNPARTSSMFT